MRFRKKPVEIEARQVPDAFTHPEITDYLDESIALAEWCGGASHMMIEDNEVLYGVTGPHIAIQTLEGNMAASPGDWIIKGVKGEFYPCKPDIFEETYEEAADASVN